MPPVPPYVFRVRCVIDDRNKRLSPHTTTTTSTTTTTTTYTTTIATIITAASDNVTANGSSNKRHYLTRLEGTNAKCFW